MLVEGVGGWLVPIQADYTVADLAREIGWPVIIVVKNRLGALNHAALTVRQVQSAGLLCAGLIINDGPATTAPDEGRRKQLRRRPTAPCWRNGWGYR